MKTCALKLSIFVSLCLTFLIPLNNAHSQDEGATGTEWVVYSVYNRLHMGEPNEESRRDFYVNIGSREGLQKGSKLKVMRKVATFDVISKRLFKDMIIPIGYLKVIHVENGAAIARLDKMLDAKERPLLHPDAVVVGDLVQPSN